MGDSKLRYSNVNGDRKREALSPRGLAWRGGAGHGAARLGRAWQGIRNYIHGAAGLGAAMRGSARRCLARRGRDEIISRRGRIRRGMARYGPVGPGGAGRGVAGQGNLFQGREKMSRRSIERELAMSGYLETTEDLAREKFQLASHLECSTSLDFDQSLELVETMCTTVLAGYRWDEKLEIFRREIRDKLKAELIEHEDACSCEPAVRYGLDVGSGCEVCPYCAEKLDKQDIPF